MKFNPWMIEIHPSAGPENRTSSLLQHLPAKNLDSGGKSLSYQGIVTRPPPWDPTPGDPQNPQKIDEISDWSLEGLRGGPWAVLGAFWVPLGPPKGPKNIEKSLPALFFPSFFLDLLFTSIFLRFSVDFCTCGP